MKTFLIILSLAASALAVDYCTLCTNHIGCNNTGAINADCVKNNAPEMIDLNLNNAKGILVEAHNEKRDLIASGKLAPYEAASRMGTIEWDEELAKTAAFNVKTCQFKHDKCRNTEQFRVAGQNLWAWGGTGAALLPEKAVKSAVDSWFSEHAQANMTYINSCTGAAGHFTVMVHERSIRVGCAMIKTKDGIWTKLTMACNYSSNNMLGAAIYVPGPAASKCTTGRNEKYTSLCSTKEPIDANQFSWPPKK